MNIMHGNGFTGFGSVTQDLEQLTLNINDDVLAMHNKAVGLYHKASEHGESLVLDDEDKISYSDFGDVLSDYDILKARGLDEIAVSRLQGILRNIEANTGYQLEDVLMWLANELVQSAGASVEVGKPVSKFVVPMSNYDEITNDAERIVKSHEVVDYVKKIREKVPDIEDMPYTEALKRLDRLWSVPVKYFNHEDSKCYEAKFGKDKVEIKIVK